MKALYRRFKVPALINKNIKQNAAKRRIRSILITLSVGDAIPFLDQRIIAPHCSVNLYTMHTVV